MQVNRQKLATGLDRSIFVIFNLLFFLTPFIFTWANQELFEFSKMLFVYVATTLLLGLWALRMVVEQKFIFKRTPLDYFLLAFLLSQIMATIFSMHLRTSWFGYYTRFNGGLLSTLTYISLFYALIANLKPKQLTIIFSSLILSSLLVSLYAIPEHFNHSPSCWLITQKFDSECWSENNNPRYRVFATFGQPNWLAVFLISLIPLNLNQLLEARKKSSRWYLLFALLTSFLALFYTKSRSGFIGLGLGLVFYGLFITVLKTPSLTKKIFKWLGVVSFLVSVIVIIYLLVATRLNLLTPKFMQTNIDWQNQNGGTPSEEIRKIVWQGAIKIWQRYPLFGSGVETFAYSYYLDRPLTHNLVSEWDFLYNKAHNELLNLLANSGIFGLLSYLGIFGSVFYVGIKNSWQQKQRRQILALLASLLAMFVANFFGFSTVVSNLLLFGFLAMIILHLTSTELDNFSENKKIEKTINLTNKEYFLSALILIIAILVLSKIWLIWQADHLFTKGKNAFAVGDWQTGLPLIQTAIQKAPHEALFYEELAGDYAKLSIAFAKNQQSTYSAQLAQKAIESGQYALQLNPVHLNFYKSQARIYILLGQLDPNLYTSAEQVLRQAIELAPSDAKLYYNLALVSEILGQHDAALAQMEYAVEIKVNYLAARNELARMYFTRGELEKAKEQYSYCLQYLAPEDQLIQEKLQIIEASLSAQTQTKLSKKFSLINK